MKAQYTPTYLNYDNDPTGLRLYTLDNGLKVFLSKNEETPKVETLIAVKAGSTYDPEDNTGLAHYLEHMMFKGTKRFGTADWETEKKYLDQIEVLYEQHKAATSPEKREAIYKQIDSVSYEASKYAIANEYDKMVSSLGAEGTNAFTSNEMTVYKNTIPSNEIDKWLNLERERFSQVVLRLFHTELETVYEEFNRSQDNDLNKHYTALLQALFPTHPYGTKTTIGTAEHLKQPSITAIKNYFNTYYVPNNMAVILVGDFEYDDMIQKVAATFGTMEYKALDLPKFTETTTIDKPVTKTVYGPSKASVYVGFRTPGYLHEDNLKLQLIDYLLANSTAGLIDVNLNANYALQSATSFTAFKNDYGMHVLKGLPKEGQSLEEVRDLLLSQIELIKQGDFEEWLLEAVVNDMKLNELKSFESTSSVAFEYLYAFIYNYSWETRLQRIEALRKLTKADLVAFANDFYKDNYVFVKKEVGENVDQVKVENPEITPVLINRDSISEFTQNFNAIVSPDIMPVAPKIDSDIAQYQFKTPVQYRAVENKTNDLASLDILFPIGKDHDRLLPLATNYLKYIGSEVMTNTEAREAFYKLGVSYSFKVQNDQVILALTGLNENLEAALDLLFEHLQQLTEDPEALAQLKQKVFKQRSNTLKDKSAILWSGLVNYSKFGEDSSFRNVLSAEDFEALKAEDLLTSLKGLLQTTPKVYYYGRQPKKFLKHLDQLLAKQNLAESTLTQNIYEDQNQEGKVYFMNYDMVQTELLLLAKKENFDPKLMPYILLFNNYFGSGLSSIVFQEIRESKSLAYAARTHYATPKRQDKSNYLFTYIGTQANKLDLALDALNSLLSDMPLNEAQFAAAKVSVLKSLATKRVVNYDLLWELDKIEKLGVTENFQIDLYEQVKQISLSDLQDFFQEHVKGTTYDLLIIGNRKDLDQEVLKRYGELIELDDKRLFNYE